MPQAGLGVSPNVMAYTVEELGKSVTSASPDRTGAVALRVPSNSNSPVKEAELVKDWVIVGVCEAVSVAEPESLGVEESV